MVSISPISEIVEEMRSGRMVILVDEEDRENEGDLVLAADFVTPEAINFMAKYGRGLICLTLTEQRCRELGLRPMVAANGSSHGTNFTVSIEAAEGVSTGISAADRAHTIRVAVNRDAKPADLVQPGHVFPLSAVNGGVLMRAGHTEAGCDLAAMAGLTPASVICEIMKDDGTMARLPDLMEFAKEHGLKIGTIADLIHYRSSHESLVERVHERPIQSDHGVFRGVAYRDKPTSGAHFALVYGDVKASEETLVRVHEPSSILDLLEATLSEHSFSIPAAMKRIVEHGSGVIVLLNCNVSSERLLGQFKSLDEIEESGATSRKGAGSSPDLRTYGVGAQILKDLGVAKMKLLSKPRKMPSMTGFDLEISGYVHGEAK
ncbi:MAG TPA: bifunctional 3,4-dihydroxy-2-butanone-4-phosphate synthase/GTP cyclohydrolase II [Limnobacter sp.]|nr:bifunctional 3,4-dihydroxy-2-butanone-4-phosphate synthase/GTP cyclohydrolase II [Limnobacter sp.]HEX5485879.1 bifunctional 3,4-dihydroxy-2-butanone-4-phosphate synthase/GTP cyclohydrolase II [Limnobacter sp.]